MQIKILNANAGFETAQKIAKLKGGDTLEFEKGTYHFYPETCAEKFYSISNNDASVKNILFYIENLQDITVDGNGSLFIMHGRISPFVISGSKNITIKNLSIDYYQPFNLQGYIEETNGKEMTVTLNGETPYRTENGKLIMQGENFEREIGGECVFLLQEFDTELKRVKLNSDCILGYFGNPKDKEHRLEKLNILYAEDIGGGRVKISGEGIGRLQKGSSFVINGEMRYDNTVFIQNSENILIQNLDIFHSPSMGIIAQLSGDITLDNVNLKLKEGRFVTSNADATHFVNCYGKVVLKNCTFENMLDDGGNFHGIHTEVVAKGKDYIDVKLLHRQQTGVIVWKKGDILRTYYGKTLREKTDNEVASAELIENDTVRLKLLGDLSSIETGDHTENITSNPDVYIENCKVLNNRPRGFLMATNKKAVIRNCFFATCAAGVHISSEDIYWYESGGITDLLIENNVFFDCCHQGGTYQIAVTPEYLRTETPLYYHKNIRVVNNTLISKGKRFLYAKGADGIAFKGNRLFDSEKNAFLDEEEDCFFEDCKNVSFE